MAPAVAMTELPMTLQFLAAWIGTWVRLTDSERRRLARLGKALGRKTLREVASIASPETILRWYRELVAKKYDGSSRRGPGRPRKAAEIVRLLLRMALENPRWGYTRLRGALANVLRDRADDHQAHPGGAWHRPGPDSGSGDVLVHVH